MITILQYNIVEHAHQK